MDFRIQSSYIIFGGVRSLGRKFIISTHFLLCALNFIIILH